LRQLKGIEVLFLLQAASAERAMSAMKSLLSLASVTRGRVRQCPRKVDAAHRPRGRLGASVSEAPWTTPRVGYTGSSPLVPKCPNRSCLVFK